MQPFENVGLQHLTSLKEAELQAKIIEPLLTKMGFTEVRDNSGPHDLGKDLIAVGEELGKPVLFAIQIKRFKFTGKYQDTKSVSSVLNQLEQMMLEKVFDPITHEERHPDRIVFITPYAINRDAIAAAITKRKELERRTIRIIDGPELFTLVQRYLPSVLLDESREYRYRVSVATSSNQVRESSAFSLNQSIELERIFVKISPIWGDENIEKLARCKANFKGPQIVVAQKSQLSELSAVHREVIGSKIALWVPPRQTRTRSYRELLESRRKIAQQYQIQIRRLKEKLKEKQERESNSAVRPQGDLMQNLELKKSQEDYAEFRSEVVAEVNLDSGIAHFQDRCRRYDSLLCELNSGDVSEQRCTAIMAEGVQLARDIRKYRAVPLVREHWPRFVNVQEAKLLVGQLCRFEAGLLLKMKQSLFITGPAGAGKTTLLRHLSGTMAKTSHTRLPILLYAIELKCSSARDVVEHCRARLSEQGLPSTIRAVIDGMQTGAYRIFVDGLDEVGSDSENLLEHLRRFGEHYPNCPIVLTVRDNYDLPVWENSVHVRLTPFDDEQLEQFFTNWFRTEPTKLQRITAWIKENSQMRESARRPLIAALLCSLVNVGGEIPATEIELYERRFELLLGRWEQAKGIDPLPVNVRTGYWHFLMKLAFEMHRKETRTIEYNDAVKASKDYLSPKFHRSGDAMIMDCIQRGLFERETQGKLSFGHLTNQEFLVARLLSQENPINVIWDVLEKSWWWKTLEMYSTLKANITSLLEEALLRRGAPSTYRRLKALADRAPYTSQSVLLRLSDREMLSEVEA